MYQVIINPYIMIEYVNFCIYGQTLKIFSLTHFEKTKKYQIFFKNQIFNKVSRRYVEGAGH